MGTHAEAKPSDDDTGERAENVVEAVINGRKQPIFSLIGKSVKALASFMGVLWVATPIFWTGRSLVGRR